jgi:hypothetical protein
MCNALIDAAGCPRDIWPWCLPPAVALARKLYNRECPGAQFFCDQSQTEILRSLSIVLSSRLTPCQSRFMQTWDGNLLIVLDCGDNFTNRALVSEVIVNASLRF